MLIGWVDVDRSTKMALEDHQGNLLIFQKARHFKYLVYFQPSATHFHPAKYAASHAISTSQN